MTTLSIIAAIFSILGAIATIISMCIAIKSKNEAKHILNEMKNEQNKNVQNYGSITQKNTGNNSGIISGINAGEINETKN